MGSPSHGWLKTPIALAAAAVLSEGAVSAERGEGWIAADGSLIIIQPEGVQTDDLGAAVAMDGNWLIAGEPGGDGPSADTGNAIIYQWQGDPYYTFWEEIELGDLVPDADLAGTAKFGYSVAIEGDYAAVGAPYESTDGSLSGRVYLFHYDSKTGWTYIDYLWWGDVLDQFGSSLAIEGSYVAVGIPGYEDFWGVVMIYEMDPTFRSARLVGQASNRPRGSNDEQFGRSLDWDGDVMVVGAPFSVMDSAECGRAYAYQVDGNGQTTFDATIDPPADMQVNGAMFGSAIAVQQSAALVGAPYQEAPSDAHGCVVMLKRDDGSWSQQYRFDNDETKSHDEFGKAVAMHDDLAIIGSPGDNVAGGTSGTAAIYRWSPSGGTWSLEHPLRGFDIEAQDRYGGAVAVGPRGVAVGAVQKDFYAPNQGAVFFYREDTGPDDEWQIDIRAELPCILPESTIANPSESTDYASFGRAVGIDGNTAIVGDAWAVDDTGIRTGATHLFTRADVSSPWVEASEADFPPPANQAQWDYLGWSVDVDGGVAVVGAPGSAQQSGHAWIYVKSGSSWSPIQKLNPFATDEQFGYDVALTWLGAKAYIVVGAPDMLGNSATTGHAYVYEWDPGTNYASFLWKLSPSGVTGLSSFGQAVDIGTRGTGTLTVAVGNPWYDTGSEGCVDVFTGAFSFGWIFDFEQRLVPDDENSSEVQWAGASLAIDGDALIVGAMLTDVIQYRDGSAWIYRGSLDGTGSYSWTLETSLGPGDGSDDFSGSGVAIDDASGTAVVGVMGSDYVTDNAGLAKVFRLDDDGWWVYTETLMSNDARPDDAMGVSVALDGASLLVGAPGYDVTESVGDRSHVLSFDLVDYVTYIDNESGSLGSDNAWTIPANGQGHALFSMWLADVYTVPFDIGTWTGSMRIMLDQVDLQLMSQLRTVTGDILVAAQPDLKMAALKLTDGTLAVGDDFTVGSESQAGTLALAADANVIVTGTLTLNATASSWVQLANTTDPSITTLTGQPSLAGSMTVDLGELAARGTIAEGDRFVLISSGVTPTELFDVLVLPGLPGGLAFEVTYGAPRNRSRGSCPPGEIEDCMGNCCPASWVGDTYCDDGSYTYGGNAIYLNCDTYECDGGDCAPTNCWTVGGEWEMAIEVVSLAGLLDFGDPNSVPVDGDPTALEVVDLTDDSAEEICVTFAGSPGSLVIFENDGAGGVGAQIVIPVGDDPIDITSGDFDNDTRTDLAVANNLSQDVWIFYNDDNDVTDGFDEYDLDVDAPPTCLAGIDADSLDADDLVVGMEDIDGDGNGYWEVFLGVGALRGGTMGPGGGIAPSGTPLGVDPSEDEDQKDFLFVGRQSGGKTSVGKNDSLLLGVVTLVLDEYVTGADPGGLTLADLDGDGDTDITTTSTTNGTVAILRGDGLGDFQTSLYVTVGTNPTRLTSVDFDADGHEDLAIIVEDTAFSGGSPTLVRILQNDGSLSFTSIDVAEGESVSLVDNGDISGDGVSELVTIGGGAAFRALDLEPMLSLREPESGTDCAGDTDGDADVDIEDLLTLLSEYDDCSSSCASDFDGDDDVDVEDLLALIANWGTCPR